MSCQMYSSNAMNSFPGSVVFVKNSKIYSRRIQQSFDGKSRTLTHFVAFEERMADKAIVSISQNRAKSLADGVVQHAVLCIYMRRIGYDSATVNIFVTEDE